MKTTKYLAQMVILSVHDDWFRGSTFNYYILVVLVAVREHLSQRTLICHNGEASECAAGKTYIFDFLGFVRRMEYSISRHGPSSQTSFWNLYRVQCRQKSYRRCTLYWNLINLSEISLHLRVILKKHASVHHIICFFLKPNFQSHVQTVTLEDFHPELLNLGVLEGSLNRFIHFLRTQKVTFHGQLESTRFLWRNLCSWWHSWWDCQFHSELLNFGVLKKPSSICNLIVRPQRFFIKGDSSRKECCEGTYHSRCTLLHCQFQSLGSSAMGIYHATSTQVFYRMSSILLLQQQHPVKTCSLPNPPHMTPSPISSQNWFFLGKDLLCSSSGSFTQGYRVLRYQGCCTIIAFLSRCQSSINGTCISNKCLSNSSQTKLWCSGGQAEADVLS